MTRPDGIGNTSGFQCPTAEVFGRTLGQAARSMFSERRDARNKWARQHNFTRVLVPPCRAN